MEGHEDDSSVDIYDDLDTESSRQVDDHYEDEDYCNVSFCPRPPHDLQAQCAQGVKDQVLRSHMNASLCLMTPQPKLCEPLTKSQNLAALIEAADMHDKVPERDLLMDDVFSLHTEKDIEHRKEISEMQRRIDRLAAENEEKEQENKRLVHNMQLLLVTAKKELATKSALILTLRKQLINRDEERLWNSGVNASSLKVTTPNQRTDPEKSQTALASSSIILPSRQEVKSCHGCITEGGNSVIDDVLCQKKAFGDKVEQRSSSHCLKSLSMRKQSVTTPLESMNPNIVDKNNLSVHQSNESSLRDKSNSKALNSSAVFHQSTSELPQYTRHQTSSKSSDHDPKLSSGTLHANSNACVINNHGHHGKKRISDDRRYHVNTPSDCKIPRGDKRLSYDKRHQGKATCGEPNRIAEKKQKDNGSICDGRKAYGKVHTYASRKSPYKGRRSAHENRSSHGELPHKVSKSLDPQTVETHCHAHNGTDDRAKRRLNSHTRQAHNNVNRSPKGQVHTKSTHHNHSPQEHSLGTPYKMKLHLTGNCTFSKQDTQCGHPLPGHPLPADSVRELEKLKEVLRLELESLADSDCRTEVETTAASEHSVAVGCNSFVRCESNAEVSATHDGVNTPLSVAQETRSPMESVHTINVQEFNVQRCDKEVPAESVEERLSTQNLLVAETASSKAQLGSTLRSSCQVSGVRSDANKTESMDTIKTQWLSCGSDTNLAFNLNSQNTCSKSSAVSSSAARALPESRQSAVAVEDFTGVTCPILEPASPCPADTGIEPRPCNSGQSTSPTAESAGQDDELDNQFIIIDDVEDSSPPSPCKLQLEERSNADKFLPNKIFIDEVSSVGRINPGESLSSHMGNAFDGSLPGKRENRKPRGRHLSNDRAVSPDQLLSHDRRSSHARVVSQDRRQSHDRHASHNRLMSSRDSLAAQDRAVLQDRHISRERHTLRNRLVPHERHVLRDRRFSPEQRPLHDVLLSNESRTLDDRKLLEHKQHHTKSIKQIPRLPITVRDTKHMSLIDQGSKHMSEREGAKHLSLRRHHDTDRAPRHHDPKDQLVNGNSLSSRHRKHLPTGGCDNLSQTENAASAKYQLPSHLEDKRIELRDQEATQMLVRDHKNKYRSARNSSHLARRDQYIVPGTEQNSNHLVKKAGDGKHQPERVQQHSLKESNADHSPVSIRARTQSSARDHTELTVNNGKAIIKLRRESLLLDPGNLDRPQSPIQSYSAVEDATVQTSQPVKSDGIDLEDGEVITSDEELSTPAKKRQKRVGALRTT